MGQTVVMLTFALIGTIVAFFPFRKTEKSTIMCTLLAFQTGGLVGGIVGGATLLLLYFIGIKLH